MAKSNVKIHHPDGIHWWGIEYNRPLEREHDSATDFVHAMREINMVGLPFCGSHWFHQCGSANIKIDDEGYTQYYGYQYFEYWGNDQDYLLQVAQTVADKLGVEVEL